MNQQRFTKSCWLSIRAKTKLIRVNITCWKFQALLHEHNAIAFNHGKSSTCSQPVSFSVRVSPWSNTCVSGPRFNLSPRILLEFENFMLRNHFEEVNVCLANTKGTLRRVFYEKCGGGGGSRFSVLSRYCQADVVCWTYGAELTGSFH